MFSLYMVRWDNRVKDISNYIKSAEDLMVRCAVIKDDRYLESVHGEWIQKTNYQELVDKNKYPEFIKAFIGIEPHQSRFTQENSDILLHSPSE